MIEDSMSYSDRRNQQIAKAKVILLALGIKLSTAGCGCCGSPRVRMEYKGEEVIGIDSGEMDDVNIDMFNK